MFHHFSHVQTRSNNPPSNILRLHFGREQPYWFCFYKIGWGICWPRTHQALCPSHSSFKHCWQVWGQGRRLNKTGRSHGWKLQTSIESRWIALLYFIKQSHLWHGVATENKSQQIHRPSIRRTLNQRPTVSRRSTRLCASFLVEGLCRVMERRTWGTKHVASREPLALRTQNHPYTSEGALFVWGKWKVLASLTTFQECHISLLSMFGPMDGFWPFDRVNGPGKAMGDDATEPELAFLSDAARFVVERVPPRWFDRFDLVLESSKLKFQRHSTES